MIDLHVTDTATRGRFHLADGANYGTESQTVVLIHPDDEEHARNMFAQIEELCADTDTLLTAVRLGELEPDVLSVSQFAWRLAHG